MGVSSQEPEPSGGMTAPVVKYLKLEAGSSACGWIVGKPFGAFVHHVGQSKVCKHKMSEGALHCRLCTPEEPPVWRGYTPVIDRDYVLRFTMISRDYLAATSEIELGSMVKITRAVGKKQSIIIRAENWRTMPLPSPQQRLIGLDILPSLWRIWRDVELERWHLGLPKVEVPAVPEPYRLVAPPVDEAAARDAGEVEMKKIANRLKGRFAVADLVEGIGAIPDPAPSKNGRHKPR